MRKFISYLLFLAMVLASMPVFAAGEPNSSVSYYQDDAGKLNVNVTLGWDAFGDVMLTVYDKDTYNASTFASLSDAEKAACILYTNSASLANGGASFTFGFNGDTGYYPYTLSTVYNSSMVTGTFAYISDEADILVNLNNKTAAELRSYLDSNASLVFGAQDIYNATTKDVVCEAMKETTFASLEVATNTALKAVLMNRLNIASADEKILIIDSYSDILGLDKAETAVFKGASNQFKTAAIALVTGDFTAEKFYIAVDLIAIKNATNYSEVNPILSRLSQAVTVDFGNYFYLSSTKAADLRLYGQNYTTLTLLENAVKAAIITPNDPLEDLYDSPGGGFGSSVIVPLPTPAAEESQLFTDLLGYDWAKPAIEVLAQHGVISGKAQGIFAPGDSVSREELVKLLVCTFGIHDASLKSSFSDLQGHWSESYIASAEKYGLVKGVSSENFGVGHPISRQDMAVLCYRFMTAFSVRMQINEAEDFADIKSVSDYATEAVKVLKSANVISGKGDNKFAPTDTSTRAEAAKVIYYIFTEKNVK